MVPLEAPYPDVYTDTFIFFLRSLCKIIWMNVHYFPNAPRIYIANSYGVLVKITIRFGLSLKFHHVLPRCNMNENGMSTIVCVSISLSE